MKVDSDDMSALLFVHGDWYNLIIIYIYIYIEFGVCQSFECDVDICEGDDVGIEGKVIRAFCKYNFNKTYSKLLPKTVQALNGCGQQFSSPWKVCVYLSVFPVHIYIYICGY